MKIICGTRSSRSLTSNHINWQIEWPTLPIFLSVFQDYYNANHCFRGQFYSLGEHHTVPKQNLIIFSTSLCLQEGQLYLCFTTSAPYYTNRVAKQTSLFFSPPHACIVIFRPLKIYLWYHKCMKICTDTEITWFMVYTKITNKTSRGNSIYRQTWAQYTRYSYLKSLV